MIFIGHTVEEAQQKLKRAGKNCSVEGGLARFSDFTNFDMSVFPRDEPFKFDADAKQNGIQGAIDSMKAVSDLQDITPNDVGEMLALGGLGCRAVGTPGKLVFIVLLRSVHSRE